jgi:hypothetical protein
MAASNNKTTNAGKIKMTQLSTGRTFIKDPEEVKQILDNKFFKGKYTSETLADAPKEISEPEAEKQ